ncbi:uncharacterized protein isoform X2 [Leptinotarsa decemlineata]|uniref:uncharacterized protein isoform X2 n=1 Tax=Leptinotarsa decemlineata TaxID=7539 RepID=UPI003D304E83
MLNIMAEVNNLPPIGLYFDYKVTDFRVFKERLENYFLYFDVNDQIKKKALLITLLSEETYKLLESLLLPDKLSNTVYDDVIKILEYYFASSRSIFAARQRFYTASRNDKENARAWSARLRSLEADCNFGGEVRVLIRDIFVTGYGRGPVQARLYKEDPTSDKVTLNALVNLATEVENTLCEGGRNLNAKWQTEIESNHLNRGSAENPVFTPPGPYVLSQRSTQRGDQGPSLKGIIATPSPNNSSTPLNADAKVQPTQQHLSYNVAQNTTSYVTGFPAQPQSYVQTVPSQFYNPHLAAASNHYSRMPIQTHPVENREQFISLAASNQKEHQPQTTVDNNKASGTTTGQPLSNNISVDSVLSPPKLLTPAAVGHKNKVGEKTDTGIRNVYKVKDTGNKIAVDANNDHSFKKGIYDKYNAGINSARNDAVTKNDTIVIGHAGTESAVGKESNTSVTDEIGVKKNASLKDEMDSSLKNDVIVKNKAVAEIDAGSKNDGFENDSGTKDTGNKIAVGANNDNSFKKGIHAKNTKTDAGTKNTKTDADTKNNDGVENDSGAKDTGNKNAAGNADTKTDAGTKTDASTKIDDSNAKDTGNKIAVGANNDNSFKNGISAKNYAGTKNDAVTKNDVGTKNDAGTKKNDSVESSSDAKDTGNKIAFGANNDNCFKKGINAKYGSGSQNDVGVNSDTRFKNDVYGKNATIVKGYDGTKSAEGTESDTSVKDKIGVKKDTNLKDVIAVKKDSSLKGDIGAKYTSLKSDVSVKNDAVVENDAGIENDFSNLNALLPYRRGQWSPTNPNGLKVYKRDFLLALKDVPASRKVPENIPDVILADGCDDKETQRLYRTVRWMIFKLTPQEMENNMISNVKKIDTWQKLQGVIDVCVDMATSSRDNALHFANLCKQLVLQVPSENSQPHRPIYTDFTKELIIKCHMEFEKHSVNESRRNFILKQIQESNDPEELKCLQFELERHKKLRTRAMAIMSFMGELYSQEMLTDETMIRCFSILLDNRNEESLECLCKMMTTIGNRLESRENCLEPYFAKLEVIAANRERLELSRRIQDMIQDVIDLRQSKWVRHHNNLNPKAGDQVQKDQETKVANTEMMDSSPSTSSQLQRNVSVTSREFDNMRDTLCKVLSTSSGIDSIAKLISTKYRNHLKGNTFIRALTTAIFTNSIENESKLSLSKLLAFQRLFPIYVDDIDKEMQCLYSLNTLINKMEYPQGLLLQICNCLYDMGAIKQETFIRWKNDDNPNEQAGKGVALKQLSSFFTAIDEYSQEDDLSSSGSDY